MSDLVKEEKSFFAKTLEAIPGILLFAAVAVNAWLINPQLMKMFPIIEELKINDFIIAIILGIVISNVFEVPKIFKPGLRFSTVLTKTGIVVMGCSYTFTSLFARGIEAVVIIGVFLFTTAIVLMWLGKKLKMTPVLSACVAAAMSVCGVSAVVAIAPALHAKNEDMAYTIAIVLMFGLLALFVFPFIGNVFELSANQFGAFVGVGIINSAQVLAAGSAYGGGAEDVAGIYNIGRVIFLPFIVLMLVMMVAKQDASMKDEVQQINKFKVIVDKFPIFVIGFLAVVTLNTFGFLDQTETDIAKSFRNWCFLLGFASIGLTTRLSDIKAAGLSGVALGFVVAGIKAAIALAVVIYFLK